MIEKEDSRGTCERSGWATRLRKSDRKTEEGHASVLGGLLGCGRVVGKEDSRGTYERIGWATRLCKSDRKY